MVEPIRDKVGLYQRRALSITYRHHSRVSCVRTEYDGTCHCGGGSGVTAGRPQTLTGDHNGLIRMGEPSEARGRGAPPTDLCIRLTDNFDEKLGSYQSLLPY